MTSCTCTTVPSKPLKHCSQSLLYTQPPILSPCLGSHGSIHPPQQVLGPQREPCRLPAPLTPSPNPNPNPNCAGCLLPSLLALTQTLTVQAACPARSSQRWSQKWAISESLRASCRSWTQGSTLTNGCLPQWTVGVATVPRGAGGFAEATLESCSLGVDLDALAGNPEAPRMTTAVDILSLPV